MAWLLLGVLATLLVIATRDALEDEPARHESAANQVLSPPTQGQELHSARSHFAQLYLSYLLKTYYVRKRGFCTLLLEKICTTLVKSEVIHSPSVCDSLPNDRFILGIGRYQHRTGLPVDGKAGPQTVRLMLGGDFSSRRGMAAIHCPGWSPAPEPQGLSESPR